jgi:hypothetical protein
VLDVSAKALAGAAFNVRYAWLREVSIRIATRFNSEDESSIMQRSGKPASN